MLDLHAQSQNDLGCMLPILGLSNLSYSAKRIDAVGNELTNIRRGDQSSPQIVVKEIVVVGFSGLD